MPIKRIGVNDVFGESGAAAQLLDKHGLTAARIAEATLRFVDQHA